MLNHFRGGKHDFRPYPVLFCHDFNTMTPVGRRCATRYRKSFGVPTAPCSDAAAQAARFSAVVEVGVAAMAAIPIRLDVLFWPAFGKSLSIRSWSATERSLRPHGDRLPDPRTVLIFQTGGHERFRKPVFP
jgi:hypothetical protein